MSDSLGTKMPWYKSRNVWCGIVTFLIGAYSAFGGAVAPAFGWTLPTIPEWLLTVLGAAGVYTRVIATNKIG